MACFAFVGRLGCSNKPFDHLRGIAALPVVPINLFVRTDAGVRGVAGLRGRRIRVGDVEAGRSNSLAGLIVLKAFGIEPDMIHAAFMPVADAAAAIADRTLDAVFVIGYPPAFHPLIGKTARLLPLAGAATDRLRREYPFFRPMKIPEGVYPGGAIHTLGVERLLVCRSELDADLVYRFTKTFFEV